MPSLKNLERHEIADIIAKYANNGKYIVDFTPITQQINLYMGIGAFISDDIELSPMEFILTYEGDLEDHEYLSFYIFNKLEIEDFLKKEALTYKNLDIYLNRVFELNQSTADDFGLEFSEEFINSNEKSKFLFDNNFSYTADGENFKIIVAHHCLEQTRKETFDLLCDYGEQCIIKKGFFREPENEAFFDALKADYLSDEDFKYYVDNIDENNLGDIMAHIHDKLSSQDLREIYENHTQSVCNLCNSNIDEFYIDDLFGAIEQVAAEAVVYVAYRYADENYAKEELDFYRKLNPTPFNEAEEKQNNVRTNR